MLADNPDAVGPLTAFVDLLAASLAWPAKDAADAAPTDADSAPTSSEAPARRPTGDPRRDWIPILGRSAAGVPAFWASADEAEGVTALADLVARHAGRAGRSAQPAVAADETGRGPVPAQIITLPAGDEDDLVEFVAAESLKQRHPDAFAVRIDGDSMAPDIRHGDIAVCSASLGPADGRAALVQLAGQIGVTCKIFRRDGSTVHLVPVNEQYPPQSFDADQVVWARRLLARVRTG